MNARRRVGAATIAVVLATAAGAAASGARYNGPVGPPGSHAGVEFTAKLAGKRPTAVHGFAYYNIPGTCKGYGVTAVSDELTTSIKVGADRRFHLTTKRNGGHVTVTVRGRFAKGYGKATGTIHITGSVAGCAAVDTGNVSWKAPKV